MSVSSFIIITSAASPSSSLSFAAPVQQQQHLTLISDLPITIAVSLPYHSTDFVIRQFFAQIFHHLAQLRRRDEAIAISVEMIEAHAQFGIVVLVSHVMHVT